LALQKPTEGSCRRNRKGPIEFIFWNSVVSDREEAKPFGGFMDFQDTRLGRHQASRTKWDEDDGWNFVNVDGL